MPGLVSGFGHMVAFNLYGIIGCLEYLGIRALAVHESCVHFQNLLESLELETVALNTKQYRCKTMIGHTAASDLLPKLQNLCKLKNTIIHDRMQ